MDFQNYQKFLDDQLESLQQCCLGVKQIPIGVSNLKSGDPWAKDEIKDIFDVEIEVAETSQTWEFIMDKSRPGMFPDVVFGSEDEDFLPDFQNYKCLQKWNLSNPNMLQMFVSELYASYLQYQQCQIESYHKLKDEFKDFLSEFPEMAQKSEIQITKGGQKIHTYNDTLKMLIPINCDFSRLPPDFNKKNTGTQKCYLNITFEPPNLSNISTKLCMSESIINSFGVVSNLEIPCYGALTLTKYVAKIQKLIQNTVDLVSESYQARHYLMFHLIQEFGRSSIIEFDSKMFLEGSFLLKNNDGFSCLFLVSLPDMYPKEPPIIVLQSIYNVGNSPLPRIELKKINVGDGIERVRDFLRLETNRCMNELKKIVLNRMR